MILPKFKISEFCYDKNIPVPQDVADKIFHYHIWPAISIREAFGQPMWASQGSAWRSVAHEQAMGRSGKGEHTFTGDPARESNGWGAVDWTCNPAHLADLLDHLWVSSPYSRICLYPGSKFIHCDYRMRSRGKRFFVVKPDGEWEEREYSKSLVMSLLNPNK